MSHILLLHQQFASKDDPGGTRHYELGRAAVVAGHRFTVIASDVNHAIGRRPSSGGGLVGETTEDGIRVLRVYTYDASHKSYPLRIFSFLGFTVASFLVGMRVKKPDVVMGTTPQIFQAISAWLIAAMRRRPFLLEVRDLWPEFAIDIGILRNPLLIRLARGLEKFLYRRADYLLVNSPAYRDYLIGKGVDAARITLISNGVDAAMFFPAERAEDFRRRFGLENKFVVTYAGALGMANDIRVVLDAAALLLSRFNIHILIVGDGKERRTLEQDARESGLTNVTFTGAFPKSEMHRVLAASDSCLAILKNIKMFSTTYPNKVFDYMAAGRPTILAIDGVIRKVIEAAEGGVFVEPGNPAALAAAIAALAENRARARQMGTRARAYVEEHFNRQQQGRQFAGFLTTVARRG